MLVDANELGVKRDGRLRRDLSRAGNSKRTIPIRGRDICPIRDSGEDGGSLTAADVHRTEDDRAGDG